jgi:hypothetical protein
MKDANGKWVGWGLGDVDPKVAQIQTFLATHFKAYAGNLVATGTYDAATAAVVSEMQRRYGLPVTGIFDYASQLKSHFIKPIPKPRVPFFTVEGHMSDMWVGPAAGTAEALEQESLVTHLPTGYNNGALPFDNASGVNELDNRVNQFAPPGTKIVVAGFSQGMIVVSDWLIDRVIGSPRENDILGVLAYGNPCRQKGSVAPWSRAQGGPPQNSGLDPLKRIDLLGLNPKFPIMDVYRKGDIFADNEPTSAALRTVLSQNSGLLGSLTGLLGGTAANPLLGVLGAVTNPSREGDIKASIYQAVARSDFFSNQFSILADIANLFTAPFDEVWGIFQAIVSGIGFIAQTGTNPHYSPFNLDGGINWVRGLLP